jgi:hypothetical protein
MLNGGSAVQGSKFKDRIRTGNFHVSGILETWKRSLKVAMINRRGAEVCGAGITALHKSFLGARAGIA